MSEEKSSLQEEIRTAAASVLCRLHRLDNVLPDWLYISGWKPTTDEKVLTKLGMTNIVNCTKKEGKHEKLGLFEYFQISVEDDCEAKIGDHFSKAVEYISAAKEKGGKVLVHCQAGQSRSASIVLAYLIHSEGYTLRDAYKYLKTRRVCVKPNPNFFLQLLSWELTVLGSNSITADEYRMKKWKDL